MGARLDLFCHPVDAPGRPLPSSPPPRLLQHRARAHERRARRDGADKHRRLAVGRRVAARRGVEAGQVGQPRGVVEVARQRQRVGGLVGLGLRQQLGVGVWGAAGGGGVGGGCVGAWAGSGAHGAPRRAPWPAGRHLALNSSSPSPKGTPLHSPPHGSLSSSTSKGSR
jgi:hypothetical protein